LHIATYAPLALPLKFWALFQLKQLLMGWGAGTHSMQLTDNAGQNTTPAVSSDKRLLLFASTRASDTLTIWRMDLQSGKSAQLTHVPGDFQPRPSPVGRWLVYTSIGSLGASKGTIMRMPISGCKPEPLTDAHAEASRGT